MIVTQDSVDFPCWIGQDTHCILPPLPLLLFPLPSPLVTLQVQVREASGERAAKQLGKWQPGALKFIPFSSDSRLGDHRPNSALTAPAWESGVWSLWEWPQEERLPPQDRAETRRLEDRQYLQHSKWAGWLGTFTAGFQLFQALGTCSVLSPADLN